MAALQVVIEQFTAERLEGRCSGWELFPQPGQVIDFTTQKDAHFYTMIDAVRPVPNQPEEVTLTLVPISGSPTLPIKEARQLSQAQFYGLKSQANAVIPISMGDMIFDLDDMGPLVFVEPDEQRSYEHIIAGFHQAKHPVIIIDPIGVDLTPIGIEPTLIGKDIRLSLQDVGILNVLNWVIQKLPNAVQGQASEFLLSLVPPTPDFVPLQYFADHPRLQEHALSAAVLHQMFVFHKAHFFANTKQMALSHHHLQHTLHLDFSNIPPDLVSYMAEGLTNVLLRYNLPKKAQIVVMSPETNETSVNKLLAQSKHRMLLIGHNEKPWQASITDWWETKKVMGEYGLVIRGEMTDDVQLFLPFSAMATTSTLAVTPSAVDMEADVIIPLDDTADNNALDDGLHVDWTPTEVATTAEPGSDYWIDQFNTEIIRPEEEAARHAPISEESHQFITDNAKPLPLKADDSSLSEADLYNLSFLESLKSKVDSPFADDDADSDMPQTALDSLEDASGSAWAQADDDTLAYAETMEVESSTETTDASTDTDSTIEGLLETLQTRYEAEAQEASEAPLAPASDDGQDTLVVPDSTDIVIDWVQQSGEGSHVFDFVHGDDWQASHPATPREEQENYFVEGDFTELSQAAASMASNADDPLIDTEHPELTNAEDILTNVLGYDALSREPLDLDTPDAIKPSETINPDEAIDLEHPELSDAEGLLSSLMGYDKPIHERDLLDLDTTTSEPMPTDPIDPEAIDHEHPELTDASAVLYSFLGSDTPDSSDDSDDAMTMDASATDMADDDTAMPEIDYGDDITFVSDVPSSRYRKSVDEDDDLQANDSWIIGGDTSGLMGGMGYFGDGSDHSLLLEFSDMTTDIGNDASGFYRLLEVDIPDITKGIPPIPIIPTGNLAFEGDVGNLENFEDLSREIAGDLIETVHESKLEARKEELELEAQVIQGSTKAYEQVYEETTDQTLRELQQWQGEHATDSTGRYDDGIDLDINDLMNPVSQPAAASNPDDDTMNAFSLDDFGFEDSAPSDTSSTAASSPDDWMTQLVGGADEGTSGTTMSLSSSSTASTELQSLDNIQEGGEFLGIGTEGLGWELQLTQGADQLTELHQEPSDGTTEDDTENNGVDSMSAATDLMNPYEAPTALNSDAETTTTEPSAPTETDWQSLIAAHSESSNTSIATWDFAEATTGDDESDTIETTPDLSDDELADFDADLQQRVSHAAFDFDEEGTLMSDMDFDGLGAINFGEDSHVDTLPSPESENSPYNESSDDGLADDSLVTEADSETSVTPELVAPDTTLEFGELALNDPYAFPEPSSDATPGFDALDADAPTASDPLADMQPADYQSIAMDLDDDLMEVLKLEGVDFDADSALGAPTPAVADTDNLSVEAADEVFGDLGDLEFTINESLASMEPLASAAEAPELTPEAAQEVDWNFDLGLETSLDEPLITNLDPANMHDVADLDLMAAYNATPDAQPTTPPDADGEWLFESIGNVDVEAGLVGEPGGWEDEMAALGQVPLQEPAPQPAAAAASTSSDEWLFPEFDEPGAVSAAASGMSNPMQAASPEVWMDDPTAPLPVDSAEPLTVVKTSLEQPGNRFKPGDHVQHKRYGMGTIKRIITMDDAQVILNINFDDVGKRLLDPSLSELEKVS